VADPRALRLLERLIASLGPIGVPVAIGGGLAVNLHGIERHTDDVDAFLRAEDRLAVVRALRQAGFTVDKVFGGFHYVAYEPDSPDLRVRIDLMFPAGDPELAAVENPVMIEKWGQTVPAFPVELLVLAKFYADQPLDRWDIAALYEHGSFEPGTVRVLLASIDADADNLADFDALMAEIRRPRAARRRPPPRRAADDD
jgi:hypothetical protein